MSTQNICFHGEIRKIIFGYPFIRCYVMCQKTDELQSVQILINRLIPLLAQAVSNYFTNFNGII